MNWKTRVKNKVWWLTFIPAVLILVQVCGAPLGYEWDFVVLNQQLALIVNALFGVLTLLGIVNDPNTKGLLDSIRAKGYEVPYDDYALDDQIGGTDE